MAGGLSRINIPPTDEPGKRRAGWSGHDGTRVTVIEVLGEARAALEGGDIKTALSSVNDAITFYGREGRGLGMPLEAPAVKSLADCQFQLQAMLVDVKFAGAPTAYHATMASKYLSDAESKTGASYGGYAEAPTPVGSLAEVTTTSPNAPGYSATGGDHSHDAVVGAAIAKIDEAIQQELAEDEDDNDAASLRVAKSALQQFLQTEHAEDEG